MPKNKVSEWSSTPSNNTDIGGINIAEGCAPSGINNAIRELMAQVKDMQVGTDADNFSIGGNLSVTGTTTLTGVTAAPTPSNTDDSTKIATTAFVRDIIPSGVIVMWSGTIATIPSGWLLCDGSNSTPDLRNRFIIGANADDGGAAKTSVTGSATQSGGSKDAIVVSHTHSITDPGHTHTPTSTNNFVTNTFSGDGQIDSSRITGPIEMNLTKSESASNTTGITINSSGSSGTNANLPPYFALCFIMKS
jgi:microcystin-dependent protein